MKSLLLWFIGIPILAGDLAVTPFANSHQSAGAIVEPALLVFVIAHER